MNEFVTVVIPTYNRAQSVGKAIRSVLAQTYTNREIIVVDDGSTDETARVLSDFGDAIRVIRQPNSGPSAARNAGTQAGRGDYVAFLDSDDEWLPEKLQCQVQLMRQPGVVLSATNWRSKYSSDSPYGSEKIWECDSAPAFVSQKGGHPIMLSSWLVRRDVLMALRGFDSAADPAEDNHLIFRLAFKGRFAITKQVLVLRETGLDDVKLSRPGEAKYHRKVARSMCLALANARVLAFSEPKFVQRQFSTLYSHYVRSEMEFAALDGNTWAARRLAFETLINYPNAKDALLALVGVVWPAFIRRRTHRKYAGISKA